jgi:hypothetical protein
LNFVYFRYSFCELFSYFVLFFSPFQAQL